MKYLYLRSLIFICLLVGFSCTGIVAQKLRPNPQNPPNKLRQMRLIQALGLTKEQIQQVRRINGGRKMQMEEAQMRVGEATRRLDLAIYADNANEEEIKTRLKDLQTAQAEVVKIRILAEFEIRKILTPEQLNKFRQLRQQFMERMNDPDLQPSMQDGNQIPPPPDKKRFPNRPIY